MYNNIINALKVTALAIVLSFGISYVYAWTTPTATPPGGNVAAPINTSGTAQTKTGNLTAGNLTAVSTSTANKAVVAPKYCIGASCITAWPTGGDNLGNHIATNWINMNGQGIWNTSEVYANDYYIRATGKWASSLGGGAGATTVRTSTVTAWRWPGATASCLANEVVTGGGGNCTSAIGYMVIAGSYPSGNGWRVQCDTIQPINATVTTYAVCMQK